MQNDASQNSPIKQSSLLSDIGNNTRRQSSPIKNQSVINTITIQNIENVPIKSDKVVVDRRSEDLEMTEMVELKKRIERPLMQEICNKIHHSTYSLEDLVETIEELLEGFIKGETVCYKEKDMVKVINVEKRGGAVFYTVIHDDKTLPKIHSRDLKRTYSLSENDIKILIESIAHKQSGKPWQIDDEIKLHFGIKDKLAPIFCTPKAAKRDSVSTNGNDSGTEKSTAESDDDDEPLITLVRRSGAGLPPTANQKVVEKKTKQIEKKLEKEKKEKPLKAKNGKADAPVGLLNKFIVSAAADSNSSESPFLTPQKRSEKRFLTATKRLADAWKKRDLKEFQAAIKWTAHVLSGVQIDKLDVELHRLAVRREFEIQKDKDALKKAKRDQRGAIRDRKKERTKNFRKTEHKIRAHFNEVIIIEDLSLPDSTSLPCSGKLIPSNDSLRDTFNECIMITQFLSSLGKFTESDNLISAINLTEGLHGRRVGFMNHTAKVLCSLVKTIIQDEEYKKDAYFNTRFVELTIDEGTVSELCRALLMGKQGTDNWKKKLLRKLKENGLHNRENDSEEKTNENGVDSDNEDESGRNTPDMDVSQIEQEECERLLKHFTEDKEVWQLCVDDQITLLRLMLFKVLDLESFKEYISNDEISDETRSLKHRIEKLNEQLDSWREALAEVEVVDEVVDESLLSRNQSRQRAELIKKRETLERKIEDNQDKMEELVDKLAIEKRLHVHSRRVAPIGQDRHLRNYYWLSQKTPDAGLWIQDFGSTEYEAFVKKCVQKNVSCEISDFDSCAEPKELWNANDDRLGKENYSEKWYRLESPEALIELIESLNKSGTREAVLLKNLKASQEEISRSIEIGNKENSQQPSSIEEDEGETLDMTDPMSGLRRDLNLLARELHQSFLTSIKDMDVFEASLISADNVTSMKRLMMELAESITESAIVKKLDFFTASQTGAYSHMSVDTFKLILEDCHNISALQIMRNYLDSRIDWKKSVREKNCRTCGSRRSPDAKMACSTCGMVVHYYCTRPRLTEKVNPYVCVACERESQKKEKRVNGGKNHHRSIYKELSDESEEDEDEGSDGDESDEEEEEGVNAKTKSFVGTSKKRIIIESDVEDDIEEEHRPTRSSSKKKKNNNVDQEKCDDAMKVVKKATRLYRTLESIPPPRGTRRGPAIPSLEVINDKISEYSSFNDFSKDLSAFLDYAKTYLAENNERKLSELETLLIDLQPILSLD